MINTIIGFYKEKGWNVIKLDKSIFTFLLMKDSEVRYVYIHDSFSIKKSTLENILKSKFGDMIILCIHNEGCIYVGSLKELIECSFLQEDTLIFKKEDFVLLGKYFNLNEGLIQRITEYFSFHDYSLIKEDNSDLYYIISNKNPNTKTAVYITIQEPIFIENELNVFKLKYKFLSSLERKNAQLFIYNPNLDTIYIGNAKDLISQFSIRKGNQVYLPVCNFNSMYGSLAEKNSSLLEEEKELTKHLNSISQILGIPLIELASTIFIKSKTRTYNLNLLMNIIKKQSLRGDIL